MAGGVVILLRDFDVRQARRVGGLRIEPWDDALLQPASVDCRLGNRLLTLRADVPYLDPTADLTDAWEEAPLAYGRWALAPSAFVLGCTLERLTLPPDLVARWEGKSSLGRCGLLTHITAGFVDPGWDGVLTVELRNLAPVPILLRPGMRIGQLSFLRLSGAAQRPYGSPALGSHYQGAATVQAARGQP